MTTGASRGADPADRIPGQIYRVGGAVRDNRLGLPVTETDWVVVGATPEAMEAAGFRAVGREFPVFLHPQTAEEYALARTERKTGPGHTGFAFHAAPEITLEADLGRRDLTVNAMAEAPDGTLIDPYGGADDLTQRRLRHVSPAFEEDPLRVLRVARFAARFAGLGFEVAPETQSLMARMAASGELAHLTPERVWQELDKALATGRPAVFFEVLHACGALAATLPELVPAAAAGCPGLAAATRSDDTAVRFTALVRDAARNAPDFELQALLNRLPLPRRHADLAGLAVRLLPALHTAADADAETLLGLLEQTDALRRPERLEGLLTVAAAERAAGCAAGPDPEPAIRTALAAARGVNAGDVARQAGGGSAAGAAVRRARVHAIQNQLPKE